jgi:hypothetical protein
MEMASINYTLLGKIMKAKRGSFCQEEVQAFLHANWLIVNGRCI